ncbi:chitin deacetylase [Lichtheimia corymbifera JMRC:FSU:9682]|uniref:Chitin deacetylase n=1 Tax=Lichtheimia corymbifera JMRC:FSU:9682 TaxID=1263082 RepID=A0A068RQM0_9FUNG|nr:chitin deacetylase [Lichtheimia corymbifera JMRC:FSU:9682]
MGGRNPGIDPVIVAYISDCLEKKKPVTLKGFVDAERDLVIQTSSRGEDLATVWPFRFGRAAKQLNATIERSKVDWGGIALEILKRQSTTAPSSSKASTTTAESEILSSSSSTSSSSSSTSVKRLTPSDQARASKTFEALDPSKMWKLTTGTIVEEQLASLVKECNFEHQCHSMILDPSLPIWNQYFTDEELNEISSYNTMAVSQLPTEIRDYLSSFKSKHTLEDLTTQHNTFGPFDRIRQSDLYWVHKAVSDALDLYHCKYFQDLDRTEEDIVRRVWELIERCFDYTNIKYTGGEMTSQASAQRMNGGRDPSAIHYMKRKRMGTKTDGLFKSKVGFLELGTCEAGKCSDTISTKSIQEGSLKCPKTLKDMLIGIVQESPKNIRNVQTLGFIVSGVYIKLIAASFPQGYVCRILDLSGWLQYPTCERDMVKKLTPIIQLVWHAKTTMTQVVDMVQMDEDTVDLSKKRSTIPIPPSFTPSSSSKSSPTNGKRSRNDLSSI